MLDDHQRQRRVDSMRYAAARQRWRGLRTGLPLRLLAAQVLAGADAWPIRDRSA